MSRKRLKRASPKYRRKSRRPSRSRKRLKRASPKRRKSRRPGRSRKRLKRASPKRRKSRRPSRSRKRLKRASPKRRKSRRPSRSRNRGVHHGFDNCTKLEKLYTKKQIQYLAKKILSSQNKREEYLNKQLGGSTLKFAYGMKSKTKYGDKAIKSAYKSAKGWVSLLSRMSAEPGLSVIGRATDNLSNILTQTVATPNNLNRLMGYVDLGYRFGYPKLHFYSVIFNLIMYGYITLNDWQVYLKTPVGINMLIGAMRGSEKEQQEVVEMFMHASCNGIAPSDIISFIPQHTDFCNKDSTIGFLLNKGLRSVLYNIGIQSGCPTYIVTEWKNIIKTVSQY
jgi:hypothetical protein